MTRDTRDILDEYLVLAAQSGDRRAFSALVERWHPSLARHAAYLLGDPAGGADAAQEAWVSIVRRLGSLRDPALFGAWAMRIVTNKCRDAARRRRRTVPASDATVEAPPGPDPESVEEVERLRLALRQLSGEQRALLALRYVDRLAVPHIARAMDLAEGTVKSRLHAARAALRRALGGDEPA